MDYTLQIHGEKRVYPVPNGLYELLSDIVREVLRAQPQSIIPFISEYLQALVTTRELSKDAVEIVDSVLTLGEENIRLCIRLGISLDEANRAAATIQAAWRGYVVRKRFRKKKDYKEKRPPHFVDIEQQERERKLAEDLDQFLERKKITYLEALTAARIIQAAWKGYRERVLKKHGRSDESVLGWAHPWLKEFDKKPVEKDDKPFAKAKLFPQRTSSLLYLPRRPIMADPQRLKALFHGQKEDYESLERSLSKLMAGEAEGSQMDQKVPAPVTSEPFIPYTLQPHPVEEKTHEVQSEIKPFLEAEELYHKIYGASEAGAPSVLVERPEFPWTVTEEALKIRTAWDEEEVEEYGEAGKEEEEEEAQYEQLPETTLPRQISHPGAIAEGGSQPSEILDGDGELEEEQEEGASIAKDVEPTVTKEEDEIVKELPVSTSERADIGGGTEHQSVTDDEIERETIEESYMTEYSENEDVTEVETDATTE